MSGNPRENGLSSRMLPSQAQQAGAVGALGPIDRRPLSLEDSGRKRLLMFSTAVSRDSRRGCPKSGLPTGGARDIVILRRNIDASRPVRGSFLLAQT